MEKAPTRGWVDIAISLPINLSVPYDICLNNPISCLLTYGAHLAPCP